VMPSRIRRESPPLPVVVAEIGFRMVEARALVWACNGP